VVDVQQRALRTLVEEIAAGALVKLDQVRNVGDHGPDALGHRQRILQHLLEVHRRRLEVVLQCEVVEVQDLPQLRREPLPVEQVRHTQRAAGGLVLVGRPDTPTRRSDGLGTSGDLPGLVQRNVGGQDQRTGRADPQSLDNRNGLGRQPVDLGEQGLHRHPDAVADQAFHVFAQDARGDQVEHRLLAPDHQRVARVVPPLETHDGGGPLGQQVDDLALSLVPPLGTDDNYVRGHLWLDP
jgi:hypothetical protein